MNIKLATFVLFQFKTDVIILCCTSRQREVIEGRKDLESNENHKNERIDILKNFWINFWINKGAKPVISDI